MYYVPPAFSQIPPNPIILRIETIEKEIATEKQAKIDAQVAAQEALQAAEIARQALVVAQEKTLQASYVAQASCSDPKSCIYMHESGNNPSAVNSSSGACGLGQALPCSKMGCSSVDYACQDAFFTNYAIGKYGSWDAAWAFWQAHSWW